MVLFLLLQAKSLRTIPGQDLPTPQRISAYPVRLYIHAPPTSRPGRWETDRKTYLKFACSDGYIYIKDLQLEGKKRMDIEDFLRGYRF